MLTGYQAEIVAFVGDGELYHRECVHEMLDEGDFVQSEMGLGSMSPLSRYSLDEFDDSYELAAERIEEYVREYVSHGEIAGATSAYSIVRSWADYPGETEARNPRSKYVRYHRLLDTIAESIEGGPTCGKCGEVIE